MSEQVFPKDYSVSTFVHKCIKANCIWGWDQDINLFGQDARNQGNKLVLGSERYCWIVIVRFHATTFEILMHKPTFDRMISSQH